MMIKRKLVFGMTALAGIALSTGVAFAATTAMGHQTTGSPSHGAVNVADVNAKPGSAVYLEADLNGRAEMMRSNHNKMGDPNGTAMVILRITQNQIMYEVKWQGMPAPSAVRLQQGMAGSAGPVAMTMMSNVMSSTINTVVGVINLHNPRMMTSMASRPFGFYANITTVAFPGGAVRGQFRQIGPVDFNAALHVGTLTSVDSADQEVPMAMSNANATVFLAANTTSVNYAAIWSGVTSPTALNINKGAIGATGDLLVRLFRVPNGLNPTIIAVAGTVTNVPMNTLMAIKANPAAFHTNLLTRRAPMGAARGQLFLPGGMMQTMPPTTTTTMPTTSRPTTTMMQPTSTMPMQPTMSSPMTTTQNMAPTTGPVTHW